MAQDDNKDEAASAINSVDTVPPPPGEDDAYNAPTKVGAMPPELLAVLRESAQKSTPRLDIATPVVPAVVANEEAPDEPPDESEWDVDVDEPVQVMDRPVDRRPSSAPPRSAERALGADDRAQPLALPPSTLGREAVFALVLLVAVIALSMLLGPK